MDEVVPSSSRRAAMSPILGGCVHDRSGHQDLACRLEPRAEVEDRMGQHFIGVL